MLQGAALGAMVGQMTYGKRQFENLDGMMRKLIPPFHQAMNELLVMVDADSSAFNSYMVRRRLENPPTPLCREETNAVKVLGLFVFFAGSAQDATEHNRGNKKVHFLCIHFHSCMTKVSVINLTSP